MNNATRHWATRLPFYFGWIVVCTAFVTMAVAVTSRTAFSLLMPPLVDEFGWDRALAAGAFSFGFVCSAMASPVVGRLMDRRGPRVVIGCGVGLTGAGLLLAPLMASPWHLYATLGALVGAGSNFMSYTVQSLILSRWFVRRRGLVISLAYAGAGIGAIVLLPWLQTIIVGEGWRAACTILGLLVLLIIGPLTLLVRRRPEDVGLLPDGAAPSPSDGSKDAPSNIMDSAWAATVWTLSRAIRTTRFWWISLGFFFAMIAWYVVQVHQTKYLIDVGFTPFEAAWSLGIVAMVAIPGQILLGAISDRIGREWIWTFGCAGFAVCYAALVALEHAPSHLLLYTMVFAQGFFGYSLTSVMGAIVVEIFDGPHFGAILGTVTISMSVGGALGPWGAGLLHDTTGGYRVAFLIALVGCGVSAFAIWMASPRKVRCVPGRVAKT